VNLEARLGEDVTAARGIVQMAQDDGADLVVVGSHGRAGVARLVLGSVAAKVVAQSPVPVLVVR
jgi:nucleotide-binding universal stress UspA family protein